MDESEILMMRIQRLMAGVLAVLLGWGVGGAVRAETYYIDYAGGNDALTGRSADQAFKHYPSDPRAQGTAQSTRLVGGDTVRFKGGVIYSGSLEIQVEASRQQPLVLDGNSDGSFGSGKAIIDGSASVGGWKRFASQEEAGGHPDWRHLFYTDALPETVDPLAVHLAQGDKLMFLSQWPTPQGDMFWWNLQKNMVRAPGTPGVISDVKVYPADGAAAIYGYVFENLVDGTKKPTLFRPADGREIVVETQKPVTAVAFRISYGADAGRITRMTFIADGAEIYSGQVPAIEKVGRSDEFTINLDKPATFSKLVFRIDAHDPRGDKQVDSIKLSELEALDAQGNNVFAGGASAQTSIDASGFLKGWAAHDVDGGFVGIWAKPNTVSVSAITGYDVDLSRLRFERVSAEWYGPGQTKYQLINVFKAIVQPGQYAVVPPTVGAGGSGKRLIAWPWKEADFEQQATCADPTQQIGVRLNGSGIVLKGFEIRKQSGPAKPSAIATVGKGELSDITIEGNLIRLTGKSYRSRGSAVTISGVKGLTIRNNQVRDNMRAIGFMISRCTDVTFSGNALRRNGDTAVDFYGCANVVCVNNSIQESFGNHANGLTFYLGNKDVLVEGNDVRCIRPLTFHTVDRITVRNNLFDAMGEGNAISMWAGPPSNDVLIEFNTLVRAKPDSFEAGIYNANARGSHHVIRNNIVDGFGGGVFANPKIVSTDHNLMLWLGRTGSAENNGEGSFVVEDPDKVFVDYAGGDYRLRAGSVAIGKASKDAGVVKDINGKPRPTDRPADLGCYQAN